MSEKTTVAEIRHAAPAPGSSHCLLVVEAGKARSFRLEPERPVVIGRGARADIQVEDGRVSREHARIHAGDVVEVEDLGSANGTWLRGAALSPNARAVLSPGDGLCLGSVLVLLQPAEQNGGASHTPPGSAAFALPEHMVVQDPQMVQLFELAVRVAASRINVLILGETGTGKELLAETLHRCSDRARKNLLCLNCAALPEALLESELFGHERGAFTGAHQAKMGLLEAVSGGTLFLDEVGELSSATQAKLLRVLESRQVTRLGSTKPLAIDVRLVAATNRELAEEVAQGRFRQDLYFRLNALTLRLPPLRQRRSEIAPLARKFLTLACQASARPEPLLTSAALSWLEQQDWPGNVRELRNVIERALVFSGAELDVAQLAFAPAASGPSPALPSPALPSPALPSPALPSPALPSPALPSGTEATMRGELAELERQRILEALQHFGGNQTRAALHLGISRRTLLKRLDQYGTARPRKQ